MRYQSFVQKPDWNSELYKNIYEKIFDSYQDWGFFSTFSSNIRSMYRVYLAVNMVRELWPIWHNFSNLLVV